MANIIIIDDESGIPLYGTVLLNEIKRSGKGALAKTYRVPAEAWIAFLHVRYNAVPEVRAYLEAVDKGEGINPRKGAMLEAIDQRIEIPLEEWEYGLKLCGLSGDDEGEEWKRGE